MLYEMDTTPAANRSHPHADFGHFTPSPHAATTPLTPCRSFPPLETSAEATIEYRAATAESTHSSCSSPSRRLAGSSQHYHSPTTSRSCRDSHVTISEPILLVELSALDQRCDAGWPHTSAHLWPLPTCVASPPLLSLRILPWR